MASETQQTVELQRSVRVGRLLIVGAVVGAVLGALITTLFPVPEDALYTMGQIAGFMLVVGGAVGLALGALLALILSAVAKRQRGTAVAELVVTHDGPADSAAGAQAAAPSGAAESAPPATDPQAPPASDAQAGAEQN